MVDGFSRRAAHVSRSMPNQHVSRLRRQERVIDTDAVVLLPGAIRSNPRIMWSVRFVGNRAHRLSETEVLQSPECLPGLRLEKHVVDPRFGMSCVDRLRGRRCSLLPEQAPLQSKSPARPQSSRRCVQASWGNSTGSSTGLPLGSEIERGDAQLPFGVENAFDMNRAWSSPSSPAGGDLVERQSGKQGNAVELLSGRAFSTCSTSISNRELFINAFNFPAGKTRRRALHCSQWSEIADTGPR